VKQETGVRHNRTDRDTHAERAQKEHYATYTETRRLTLCVRFLSLAAPCSGDSGALTSTRVCAPTP